MSTGMPPVNPLPPPQNRVPPSQEPPPDQVVPPTANQNLIAAQPPSQTQNRPVDQVRALMRSTNPFTDYVSTDDLKQVKQTFERLPAADANTTFSQLSDQEIRNITGEMQAPGIGDRGGLSANDRRDVIANMSQKLDAKNFERFAAAYGNPQEIADVLAAPGSKASTDAKIGFISAFDDKIDGGMENSGPFFNPDGARVRGNESARAIGTVLGSMRNDKAGIERAINPNSGVLDRSELQQVLWAGATETQFKLDNGTRVTSHETSRLNNILTAVATSDNAKLKAQVFEDSSKILGAIQSKVEGGGAAASSTAAAMNQIMQSDPRGIVAALRASDPSGGILTPWTRQMMSDGKGLEINRTLNALRSGPKGPGHHNTYLQNPSAQQDLGFMLGASMNGLRAIRADAKDKADLLGKIIGVTVKQLPTDILGKSLVDLSVVGSERSARDAISQVASGDKDAPRTLYNLVIGGVHDGLRAPIQAASDAVFNTNTR
jgi:hypothetical protein